MSASSTRSERGRSTSYDVEVPGRATPIGDQRARRRRRDAAVAHQRSVGRFRRLRALSPKGERALFTARGDVFTAPIVKDGVTRNLTRSAGVHDKARGAGPPTGARSSTSQRRAAAKRSCGSSIRTASGKPEQLTKGGTCDALRPHVLVAEWQSTSRSAIKDGKLWRAQARRTGRFSEIADEKGGLLQGFRLGLLTRRTGIAFTLTDASTATVPPSGIWHAGGQEDPAPDHVEPMFSEGTRRPGITEGNYLFYLSAIANGPRRSRGVRVELRHQPATRASSPSRCARTSSTPSRPRVTRSTLEDEGEGGEEGRQETRTRRRKKDDGNKPDRHRLRRPWPNGSSGSRCRRRQLRRPQRRSKGHLLLLPFGATVLLRPQLRAAVRELPAGLLASKERRRWRRFASPDAQGLCALRRTCKKILVRQGFGLRALRRHLQGAKKSAKSDQRRREPPPSTGCPAEEWAADLQ